jgi:hypothetical protein
MTGLELLIVLLQDGTHYRISFLAHLFFAANFGLLQANKAMMQIKAKSVF